MLYTKLSYGLAHRYFRWFQQTNNTIWWNMSEWCKEIKFWWSFLTPPPFFWLLKKNLSLGHRDAAHPGACGPALRPRPGRSGLGTPEGGAVVVAVVGWVGVGIFQPGNQLEIYSLSMGHQLVMGKMEVPMKTFWVGYTIEVVNCWFFLFFFLEEGVIV